MVSIMPGMEALAPERTRYQKGIFGIPEFLTCDFFKLLHILQ
jgi:hypothetical protein